MKYKIKTPRDTYKIEADNKADGRKVVFEKENMTIEKVKSIEPNIRITDLRKKLPYQKSVGTNKKKSINTVVIHHDGQWRPKAYSSFNRYSAQAEYHIGKGWSHISYHYVIDNVGEIFQCLDVDDRAYHAGNWLVNLRSIAVKFDGNMDVQPLTAAQKSSYKTLMTYLTTQRPDLPKVLKGSEIAHKEIKKTACPGKNTMDIIHNY